MNDMVYLIDASLPGGVLMTMDVTWDPVLFARFSRCFSCFSDV